MKIASSSSSSGRVDALDGLRALALLLVLLFHLTPNHNSNHGLRSIVFKIADIGWSGVDLFFVLSGFLITGILLRAKASNSSFSNFLMRRFLRILPAYYLSICIIFLFVPVVLRSYPIPSMSAQAPYWFYLSNLFESTPDLGGDVTVGHFWSLAVEIQFYVIWPLVVYRLTLETLLKVGLAALVFALTGRTVAVILDVKPWVTFGWLPFRMDGLVVGSLIAVAVHAGVRYERVKSALLFTLVVGSIFTALITYFGHPGYVLFSETKRSPLTLLVLRVILPCELSLVYGAALWISLQRNLLSAALGSSFFRPLALYSYGIYIIHYLLIPIFERSFGPQILVQWTGGQDAPLYLYFVLASSISFVLAIASYHLFEVHFLRLKPNFSLSAKPLATTIPEPVV